MSSMYWCDSSLLVLSFCVKDAYVSLQEDIKVDLVFDLIHTYICIYLVINKSYRHFNTSSGNEKTPEEAHWWLTTKSTSNVANYVDVIMLSVLIQQRRR